MSRRLIICLFLLQISKTKEKYFMACFDMLYRQAKLAKRLCIHPLYIVWKVSIFGVILVHIFPAFPRIRTGTEYGKIQSISPYSVWMWENVGKMRTRITPNIDTFHSVVFMIIVRSFFKIFWYLLDLHQLKVCFVQ